MRNHVLRSGCCAAQVSRPPEVAYVSFSPDGGEPRPVQAVAELKVGQRRVPFVVCRYHPSLLSCDVQQGSDYERALTDVNPELERRRARRRGIGFEVAGAAGCSGGALDHDRHVVRRVSGQARHGDRDRHVSSALREHSRSRRIAVARSSDHGVVRNAVLVRRDGRRYRQGVSCCGRGRRRHRRRVPGHEQTWTGTDARLGRTGRSKQYQRQRHRSPSYERAP
jgi:hypothetical protein